MHSFDKIAELLNHLPLDLRAEVVAVDIESMGVEPDQFIIKPVSIFKRRFSKDISDVSVQKSATGREELHVDLTRDGLYDVLPEGFFHQPKLRRSERNRTTIISDVKRVREEEESARLFFQPMENEVFKVKAAVERAERRLFLDMEESVTNNLLTKFWNLGAYREFRTLPFLVRLLPVAYRITGNLEQVRICYEILLGVPVNIEIVNNFQPIKTGAGGWNLGGDMLGFETVLSTTITNYLPSYEITLGPIPHYLLKEFVPGGRMTNYLSLMNSYFLVAGYDIKTNLIPEMNRVADTETAAEYFMGVNSYL